MMNRLLTVAGLTLGALLATPAIHAASITMYQNGYSYGDGGEFTAYTTPDSFLEYYVPNTIVNGGFETFCVELSVEFNPGVTYNFNQSNTDSQGRALTAGAAYLYYQFAKGNLTGYDYTGGSRWSDAGQLQAALWYIQGDQVESGFPNGGAGNTYYDDALTALGNAANVEAPNAGQFDVSIMQLWDDAGDAHQNQLVISGTPLNRRSVPDGGTTAGLLGLAVVGIVTARKTLAPQPATVPARASRRN